MVLWLMGLILASCIFLMRCCPDTPTAARLHRYLAVEPVRWFMELRRKDVFYFLLIAGFAAAGGEVFAVLGPEVVLMYAADVALYLDLVIVSSLVAAASRFKVSLACVRESSSALRQRARRPFRRARRQRATRSARETLTPDNDDEESWRCIRLAA